MMIRLKRDLTLPLAKKGCTYYGNTIAFPGDACEEVFMKGEQK